MPQNWVQRLLGCSFCYILRYILSRAFNIKGYDVTAEWEPHTESASIIFYGCDINPIANTQNRVGGSKYTFSFTRSTYTMWTFYKTKILLQFLLWSNQTKNYHHSVKTDFAKIGFADLYNMYYFLISKTSRLDQMAQCADAVTNYRVVSSVTSHFCYSRALMMSTNSGFREAPPTRKPSTSPWDASSLQFAPVTEPGRRREGRVWWVMRNLWEKI